MGYHFNASKSKIWGNQLVWLFEALDNDRLDETEILLNFQSCAAAQRKPTCLELVQRRRENRIENEVDNLARWPLDHGQLRDQNSGDEWMGLKAKWWNCRMALTHFAAPWQLTTKIHILQLNNVSVNSKPDRSPPPPPPPPGKTLGQFFDGQIPHPRGKEFKTPSPSSL